MTLQIDKDHLDQHGYVLVENVVPEAECQAVVSMLCDYLGVRADKTDPDFVRQVGEVYNGIVPLHQHQALWDTRQSPGMHEAFTQAYDNSNLWVSVDRVSYKPRLSARAPAKQGDPNSIHVDRPVLRTSDYSVQGVLYLTDTAEDQGAWECVPELYEEIASGQRTSLDKDTAFGDYDIKRVPGPAGSLVIWNDLMPHSSSHNWTDVPRFVQYITMHPEGNDEDREERIRNWRDRRAPAYWRNMPNQEDPEPWSDPATLTPLGEQLLGSRPW